MVVRVSERTLLQKREMESVEARRAERDEGGTTQASSSSHFVFQTAMPSLPAPSGLASSSSSSNSTPLYVVKTTEEGGQSLFSSTESIPRGTLLFSDSPLFTIPQDARSLEDIQGRVRMLAKEQQRAFFSLSNCRSGEKDVSPVMGIFKVSSTLPSFNSPSLVLSPSTLTLIYPSFEYEQTNVLPAGPGE